MPRDAVNKADLHPSISHMGTRCLITLIPLSSSIPTMSCNFSLHWSISPIYFTQLHKLLYTIGNMDIDNTLWSNLTHGSWVKSAITNAILGFYATYTNRPSPFRSKCLSFQMFVLGWDSELYAHRTSLCNCLWYWWSPCYLPALPEWHFPFLYMCISLYI